MRTMTFMHGTMLALLALPLAAGIARGQADAPEVNVAHPVEREISGYAVFAGVTEATQSVELRPRVKAPLVRIQVQEGALVKAGNVLFELDARPFQAACDRAQAELERGKAHHRLTAATLARARKLLESRAATPEELQLAEAEHAQSEAALLAAQAHFQEQRSRS